VLAFIAASTLLVGLLEFAAAYSVHGPVIRLREFLIDEVGK
jgi:hypothetical protein